MEQSKNGELFARSAEPGSVATHRGARRPRRSPPISKLCAARQAVRTFLLRELRAREVRITKIAPSSEGDDGWRAEAEMLVPDLNIKTLGLPLTQEVLEREYCAVALDREMQVKSYEFIAREER